MHSADPRRSTIRSLSTAVALALAALLSAGGSVAATAAPLPTPATFRVDCKAAVKGDGVTTPWNSLSAVTQHGPFTPGDRVLLRRGTTCKGMVAPSGSGTSARPITLGAYGSGARPIIAGNGTRNATAAVLLSNVQYWTVSGLRITNRTTGKSTKNYRSGLMFWNTTKGRLRGLKAENLQIDNVTSNLSYTGGNPREWGGLVALTSGAPGSGFDDMVLRANTISKVGRTGIAVINHNFSKSPDRNVRISSNRLADIRGDGILLFGARKAQIDHNVVARASSLFPCAQCEKISRYTANAAIWPAQSSDVLVTRNEVYGTRVADGDGEAFDIDASAKNVVVEYNYAHDNDGGAVLFCASVNAVVRFNIFENNKKSTFAFIGSLPAKNSTIYNNTIYQSKKSDAGNVRYFNGAKGKGIRFFNNVVYNYGRANWTWPTKVSAHHNTVIGVHKAGEPRGLGWSWRNPGLKKPGSGRIGFGSLSGYRVAKHVTVQRGGAIPKSVTRDFFGKKINPKKPPRGAAG